MTNNKTRGRQLAWLAGLMLPALGWAQAQDFSKIEIESLSVADGIYMLLGSGGNIGVSTGPDGIILIDDQYAPLSAKIAAAVAAISDKPIRMVLNTHWHGDHAGGNENFADSGAVIVAHDNVRVRMSAPFFSEFFKSQVPASPAGALPVITFDQGLTLHLNGETIEARYLPSAHTDGDAIVWFRKANVVHMGDIFFNGLYPFIDHDSGGSIRGMIAAIDTVLPEIDTDTQVIPGHGPLSDRDGLVRFRNMLQTVADRVQQLIDAGKSTDEIIAAAPSASYDAEWSWDFIDSQQWIGLVCRSLGCP